jgi:tRNA(Met) cytidine acetyltransferase
VLVWVLTSVLVWLLLLSLIVLGRVIFSGIGLAVYHVWLGGWVSCGERLGKTLSVKYRNSIARMATPDDTEAPDDTQKVSIDLTTLGRHCCWLQGPVDEVWPALIDGGAAPKGDEQSAPLRGSWIFFGFSEAQANALSLNACCETASVWSAQTPSSQLSMLLGGAIDGLVFNAWSGFHPDRLALLSGALRGGGVLVLISPATDQWPQYADPEYQRLISQPGDEESATTLKAPGYYLTRLVGLLECAAQNGVVSVGGWPVGWHNSAYLPSSSNHAPTSDQGEIVSALVEMVENDLSQPSVMGAMHLVAGPRGRGKSQVLAYCLGRLGDQTIARSSATPRLRVVIIVPHPEAVVTIKQFWSKNGSGKASGQVYELADALSREAVSHQQNQTGFDALDIVYATPAAWCNQVSDSDCDVLLIEEAAAIPLPVLLRVLSFSGPVIMATTTLGYEGSGRLLAEGFVHWLAKCCAPKVSTCASTSVARPFHRWHLTQPLRWSASDSLEPLLNQILLVDASVQEKALDEQQPVLAKAVQVKWVDQATLVAEPQTLSQVWTLLYGAHYRTRPSDLRALLDQPGVFVGLASVGEKVVGAAWFVLEGPFSPGLADAIVANRRRPKGHILPQVFALRLGYTEALRQRHIRCVRIAVDPSYRRRAIAKTLLSHVELRFGASVASIGASCALQPETAAFWQACGFQLLRLGVKPNARSGAISCAAFRPCSSALRQWARGHRQLIQASWPQYCRQFASAEVVSLVQAWVVFAEHKTEHKVEHESKEGVCLADKPVEAFPPGLDTHCRQRLAAFARGSAEEADVAGLWAPIMAFVQTQDPLGEEIPLAAKADKGLWLRLGEGWPWAELVSRGVISTRKAGLAQLRAVVQMYLKKGF